MFTTITDFITGLFQLITKAIPSDEERIKRLEIKTPWLAAKLKLRIINMYVSFLQKNAQMKVSDFVEEVQGDAALLKILQEQLGRP